ncbi:sensor histidine kinase [Methylobacillus flagellatus]|uniref:Putative signal transduction histidine kinase n=1 Tax=Methylobacillus flagellatus (strain ATCC 51484 / DSM 6875 / VKM B-1610 / KT) TaxID=265072 RepID=Q1GZT2_METFK|nr:ATP-binding protein [Methylobacillus flagellatus]ABE50255.1 putative signal transduction histidine kinase [Methylobacillus flagellatus KT]
MSPLSEIRKYLESAAQSSRDDIYAIDPERLQLMGVLVDGAEAPIADHPLDDLLQALREPSVRDLLDAVPTEAAMVDISHELHAINRYFGEFRLLMVGRGSGRVLLVMRDSQAFSRHILHVLNEGANLSALISNAPGVVYQAHMSRDGAMRFLYLSDACKPLLGEEAEALIANPDIFLSLIDEEDRGAYEKNISQSAHGLSVLNWTGRFWMQAWQDTKWINLRATPRKMPDGTVMWEGIMTNITQSRREQQAIRESHEKLARLSAQLAQIKEKERLKIAQEVHDDLGGNLTAIRLGLSSMIKRLGPEQEVLLAKARQLEAIVDDTFEAAHRIASDLRPNVLELGIVAALEWQATQFVDKIGIPCEFVCNVAEVDISTDHAITLFRICQEAMSNIAKYAKASHVEVTLEASAEEIMMQVIDDGIGIAPVDRLKANAFGISGMSERAVALAGQCKVQAGRQGGTIVSVTLPLHPVKIEAAGG